MDANLLRMVTRDSDVRKLLATNDRASIEKSRVKFEAAGRCRSRLDLFSGISEILLTVKGNQKSVQTLDRQLNEGARPNIRWLIDFNPLPVNDLASKLADSSTETMTPARPFLCNNSVC